MLYSESMGRAHTTLTAFCERWSDSFGTAPVSGSSGRHADDVGTGGPRPLQRPPLPAHRPLGDAPFARPSSPGMTILTLSGTWDQHQPQSEDEGRNHQPCAQPRATRARRHPEGRPPMAFWPRPGLKHSAPGDQTRSWVRVSQMPAPKGATASPPDARPL